MDAQLRELIPFLRDRNPQVRQIALEHLLPQTPPGSPHRSIFFSGLQAGGLQTKPKETDIIRDLKLLCRDQLNIAHDAFRALVNLSDSPLLLSPLSEPNFLTFIVSYIIHPQSILADLASMLLSNLTSSSAACSAVLSLKVPIIPDPSLPGQYYATQSRCGTSPAPDPYPTGEAREVLALPLLLNAFATVQAATEDPSKRIRKGELHFLASVFANLTAASTGRTFFLTPQPANPLKPEAELEYPLAKIVPFTEHKDTIRRGGVTSTIKNCAFHAKGHKAILSPDTVKVSIPPSTAEAPGIDALPYILLPLAGPEEFELEDQEKLLEPLQFLPATKTREPDATLRLMHVETLLLLCHTRWGRDYLREHGVYEIIRAMHLVETVDKISEHIERLVTLLKGEEPSDPAALEEEEGEGTQGDITDASLGAPQGTAPATKPVQEEEQDEDTRIEEV
ncbi:putative protein with domain of unknown function (DUF383) [Lyophyllum shimeji]|uniref:Protein HGH1 homolog n=1 Tax=Lyophyllum shimeji TaxID=47721 RepID=A0A9P3PXA9_LYOSH|nr:putative protein with domain of unknown function (DUF383) [Lyophyllum shimeji]